MFSNKKGGVVITIFSNKNGGVVIPILVTNRWV